MAFFKWMVALAMIGFAHSRNSALNKAASAGYRSWLQRNPQTIKSVLVRGHGWIGFLPF
jgi:hypothetical protein